VIFAWFEAALLTQGNENGVKSAEKRLRQAMVFESLYPKDFRKERYYYGKY